MNGDAIDGHERQAPELLLSLPAELIDRLADEVAARALDRAAERLRLEAEPYMNTEEAAAYLACKPQRIHDLVYQGRLPCRKDGKRSLFRRDELDAYLESRA